MKEDWNLKNADSRKKTFRDSKKIVKKNYTTSFSKIDIILNDISYFWFNKNLQLLAKKLFKNSSENLLTELSLELATLSNISFLIIEKKEKTQNKNSVKIKNEYSKLEKEVILNVITLLKNIKASSRIIWEIRSSDIESWIKEIDTLIKYHIKEVEKIKQDFFKRWAKSENIWLYTYNF